MLNVIANYDDWLEKMDSEDTLSEESLKSALIKGWPASPLVKSHAEFFRHRRRAGDLRVFVFLAVAFVEENGQIEFKRFRSACGHNPKRSADFSEAMRIVDQAIQRCLGESKPKRRAVFLRSHCTLRLDKKYKKREEAKSFLTEMNSKLKNSNNELYQDIQSRIYESLPEDRRSTWSVGEGLDYAAIKERLRRARGVKRLLIGTIIPKGLECLFEDVDQIHLNDQAILFFPIDMESLPLMLEEHRLFYEANLKTEVAVSWGPAEFRYLWDQKSHRFYCTEKEKTDFLKSLLLRDRLQLVFLKNEIERAHNRNRHILDSRVEIQSRDQHYDYLRILTLECEVEILACDPICPKAWWREAGCQSYLLAQKEVVDQKNVSIRRLHIYREGDLANLAQAYGKYIDLMKNSGVEVTFLDANLLEDFQVDQPLQALVVFDNFCAGERNIVLRNERSLDGGILTGRRKEISAIKDRVLHLFRLAKDSGREDVDAFRALLKSKTTSGTSLKSLQPKAPSFIDKRITQGSDELWRRYGISGFAPSLSGPELNNLVASSQDIVILNSFLFNGDHFLFKFRKLLLKNKGLRIHIMFSNLEDEKHDARVTERAGELGISPDGIKRRFRTSLEGLAQLNDWALKKRCGPRLTIKILNNYAKFPIHAFGSLDVARTDTQSSENRAFIGFFLPGEDKDSDGWGVNSCQVITQGTTGAFSGRIWNYLNFLWKDSSNTSCAQDLLKATLKGGVPDSTEKREIDFNSRIEEEVSRQLQAHLKKAPNSLNKAFRDLSASLLKVDATEVAGEDALFSAPLGAFDIYSELTDYIYIQLYNHLDEYAYGSSWIVQKEDGSTIDIPDREPGKPFRDSRSLSELGIWEGSVLKVVDLESG